MQMSKVGMMTSQYTHVNVAAIALTPLTTHPQTQAGLVNPPVRGQEQEQPDYTILIAGIPD